MQIEVDRLGAWPIWLSHHFTEVITFEPERTNYVCLERNSEQYKNIEIHHAALGAEVGTAALRVCRSIGSHYLLPESGDTRVLTIDGFNLEHCDLIVLDVEGYEFEALSGAMDTIKRCQPIIQIEDRGHGIKKGNGKTFDDICKLLEEYSIYQRVGRDVVFKPWSVA